jgi:Na+/glutamate symporter
MAVVSSATNGLPLAAIFGGEFSNIARSYSGQPDVNGRVSDMAMSELSPLCAQKRKLNVTTIWTALAICCLALIVAAAFWGLIGHIPGIEV